MAIVVAVGKDVVLARLKAGSMIIPRRSSIRRAYCVDFGPEVSVGSDEVVGRDSCNRTVNVADTAIVLIRSTTKDGGRVPPPRNASGARAFEAAQSPVLADPPEDEVCGCLLYTSPSPRDS